MSLDLPPDTTDTVWIGGRQADPVAESDDWVWDLSGQIVDPNLWYQGQPNDNGRGQDHMCLWKGENGLHDLNQVTQAIFVCETSGEYLLC